MKTHLAFGKEGIDVDLPESWDVTVIEPVYEPGVSDPAGFLRQALISPIESPSLADFILPTEKVGIIFCDITRPAPSHLMVPAILDLLRHIPPENITLFAALGTHRLNTKAELIQILGESVVNRFRIVQNDTFDPRTQAYAGRTKRGHDVYLNRELLACDVKILTGFIEPHFFAGFSGGGKAIIPGMAGLQTILQNHDAYMISNPNSTWGKTEGNPIWEEINEVLSWMGKCFLLNVSLNRDKQITNAFAGHPVTAHRQGCDYVRMKAMVPVQQPYDLVITSNSGYPLDLNVYQSVKGMSAASLIVREGGSIIMAADCWDGIPAHGLYGELLRQAGSATALLDMIFSPGFLKHDQWQAQIQAQILKKASIYLYTQRLTEEQIRSALLIPAHDICETARLILNNVGGKAKICVMPEGPQTIPYLVTNIDDL